MRLVLLACFTVHTCTYSTCGAAFFDFFKEQNFPTVIICHPLTIYEDMISSIYLQVNLTISDF